jgi:two-component system response regulator RstA
MSATIRGPVFLVEDDEKLSGLIRRYLERHYYSVSCESDGSRAVARILDESPAIVILDIMLPGKDGRAICKELRGRYDGPIVILTALDEEVDQIVGLEIGADDYITKPVRPQLLLSRINAMLRFVDRSSRHGNRDVLGQTGKNEKIAFNGFEIHMPSRTVFVNDRRIELTTSQFDLLSYLAIHAGEIISRDRLYRRLRGIDYDGINRSIDLTIVRLRGKIGDDGKHPRIIKSIRGEGYLMVKP